MRKTILYVIVSDTTEMLTKGNFSRPKIECNIQDAESLSYWGGHISTMEASECWLSLRGEGTDGCYGIRAHCKGTAGPAYGTQELLRPLCRLPLSALVGHRPQSPAALFCCSLWGSQMRKIFATQNRKIQNLEYLS